MIVAPSTKYDPDPDDDGLQLGYAKAKALHAKRKEKWDYFANDKLLSQAPR